MSWINELFHGLEWRSLLVGGALSGLLSFIIGYYWTKRLRVRFAIDDIFVLQKHGMDSFENYHIALIDKTNQNKRLTGDLVLANFQFINTGNKDIRIEHGDETLGFQIEPPCSIVDISSDSDFRFVADELFLTKNVLHRGERAEVGVILEYPDVSKDIEQGNLIQFVTVKSTIDDLPRVSSATITLRNIIGWLVAFIILYFCVSASILFITDMFKSNDIISDLIGSVFFLVMGGVIGNKIYREIRVQYNFKRRQKR